jgi:hypothetical protein
MARDNSIDSGTITTRLRTLSDEMPLTVLVARAALAAATGHKYPQA